MSTRFIQNYINQLLAEAYEQSGGENPMTGRPNTVYRGAHSNLDPRELRSMHDSHADEIQHHFDTPDVTSTFKSFQSHVDKGIRAGHDTDTIIDNHPIGDAMQKHSYIYQAQPHYEGYIDTARALHGMTEAFVAEQNYINQMLTEEEAARQADYGGGKKEERPGLRGPYRPKPLRSPRLARKLGKARMKAAGSLTVDSITKKYKADRKQIRDGGGGSIFQTEQTEEEERRGAAAGTVAAGSAGAGIAAEVKGTGIKTTRDTARAARDTATKKASSLSDQLADAIKASRIPDPGDKWIGAGKNPIFSGEGPYSPQAYFDNPNIEDYDKPRTTPQRDAMQDLFNKFSDENRLNRQGLRQTGMAGRRVEKSRLDMNAGRRIGDDKYRMNSRGGFEIEPGSERPTYETSPDRERVSKMGDEYRDAIRNAPDTPDVAAARAAAGKADDAAAKAAKTANAASRQWHKSGKVMRALGPVGAGLSIPFNFMQGKEYGKGLVDTGDRTSKLEQEAGLRGQEVKPSPFSPYNTDSLGTKAKDAASAALQGTKQNIKDIGKDYSKTDAILDVATLGNWSGVQALGRQFGVMDDALMKDRVTDLDNTTRTASPDGPVTQAERQALVTQRTGQEDDVSRRSRNARIRRKNAPEFERKAMGY